MYLVDLLRSHGHGHGGRRRATRANACCTCGRRRRPAPRVRPRGPAAGRRAPAPVGPSGTPPRSYARAGRRQAAPRLRPWGPAGSALPRASPLCCYLFFLLNCRRFKWKAGWNWWRTIPGAVIELDADEFNFGVMLTEQASTRIPQRYLQRLLPL